MIRLEAYRSDGEHNRDRISAGGTGRESSRKAERGAMCSAPFVCSYGGDGGSRTPVQRARPQTSTGLAPRLISPAVARVAERLLGQPDVLADSAQASATRAPDL